MNKRFLSTLLFGALFIASTSVFVSCKDYDDDIKNLQTQIDKAALKSDLTALQTQLTNASTNAETAMKNLEEKLAKQAAEQNASTADLQKQIDAVKAAADEAAKDLAAKIKAAADAAAAAQQAAGDAAEQAKAAKEAAEQAVKEAVEKLNAENAALAKQLEQLGNQMKEYVTATELNKQIQELKDQIAHMDGAAAAADVETLKAAINELYKAITSIEIIDSFTGYDFLNGGYNYWWRYDYDLDDYVYLGIRYDWDEAQGQDVSYAANPNVLHFPLTHGFVPEDATFGDNELNYKDIDGKEEIALPLVKYTKGADIKDPTYGLIVRVNPVNADLTTTDLRLINSLGEDISDFVKIGTPERYHTLLTRAKFVNNGLWILPFEVAKGVDEKEFLKKTTVGKYITETWGGDITEYPLLNPDRELVFAVAANNTQENDPSRYVVSSYDVSFSYNQYIPANHFTFKVYNELSAAQGRSVEYIHNRYVGTEDNPLYGWFSHPIWGDNTTVFYGDNYELEWLPTSEKYPAPTAVPVGKGNDGKSNYQNNVNLWSYNPVYMNDMRHNYQCLAVGLNETFTINNIAAYTEYGDKVAIDSIYVVLDKHNAVESEPSEINAWEGYKIEGLNQTVNAAKGISLKVTDPRANGDVIGFRVFAVNRDGSLVDPDGRAFYILVTDKASNNQLDAEVTAKVGTHTDKDGNNIIGNQDTSTEMKTEKLWNKDYYYELSVASTNPVIVVNKNTTAPATLDYFHFNWDGKTPKTDAIWTGSQYTGTSDYVGQGVLTASLKKLTITPTNIENLVDGETYVFYLTAYEYVAGTRVNRNVTTITLKKTLPVDADKLTFRPKQEMEDGTGKVKAYMIPNKQGTLAYGYFDWDAINNFAPHQAVADMEACYDARDAKATYGFKNLTNIFYNLSKDGQNGYTTATYNENEWVKTFEFKFGTSNDAAKAADKGKKDLVDKNDKGVAYRHPEGAETWQKYMLEVPYELIDDKTEHAVSYGTSYPGIQTTLKADGSVDKFNTDYYRSRSDHPLTFIYSCWHFANSFAWKAATAQPKLKWSHEGKQRTSPFTDIVSKNTYDPAFFGDGTATATSKTLKTLADKNFLIYQNCALYTEQGGKGQKNPYYVPSIAGTTITYTQNSTQTDAAPVADHTEYLYITWKDAFNHNVVVELPVTIQRP